MFNGSYNRSAHAFILPTVISNFAATSCRRHSRAVRVAGKLFSVYYFS